MLKFLHEVFILFFSITGFIAQNLTGWIIDKDNKPLYDVHMYISHLSMLKEQGVFSPGRSIALKMSYQI